MARLVWRLLAVGPALALVGHPPSFASRDFPDLASPGASAFVSSAATLADSLASCRSFNAMEERERCNVHSVRSASPSLKAWLTWRSVRLLAATTVINALPS
jgi:hypothetical protein